MCVAFFYTLCFMFFLLLYINQIERLYDQSEQSFSLYAPGLPLCSLGIMKDAWDRLRQCISPVATMSHCGENTLPILNQVFQFVCGNLIQSSPSPVLTGGQSCSQADPKAITVAIQQQQQRAEVSWILLNVTKETRIYNFKPSNRETVLLHKWFHTPTQSMHPRNTIFLIAKISVQTVTPN